MTSILLGMKHEPYYEWFNKYFIEHFEVIQTNISTFEDVRVQSDKFKPDVLILAERFLDISNNTNVEDEILELIENLSSSTRICYICKREIDDKLFDGLKTLGVTDIFFADELDIIRVLKQLKRRPNPDNVVFYGTTTRKRFELE